MAKFEGANPNREPNIPTGIGKFWRHIRRSKNSPETQALAPISPENIHYDIHRDGLAAQMLTFFNIVDARVAEWIGYSGNIREELKGRVPAIDSYDRRLNLKDLDPVLKEHMDASVFTFWQRREEGKPAARYEINCQVGGFNPAVYMDTDDGYIQAMLSMGPERDNFESVGVRRVYGDRRLRNITTFTPNSRDPYAPRHPLVVEQGTLIQPGKRAIYDNIDAVGNVTLFDGQLLYPPYGDSVGKYSAADRTIVPHIGSLFPYERTEDHLLIGSGGHQIAIPFQTNIYNELDGIMAIRQAIE